jgi:16S rRNA (adenine1518-N6/adenine1519-N6)-dimethyltransferase
VRRPAGPDRARRSRRALGQHFLSDERILGRVVEALEPEHADEVLEIGSGTGSLTRLLATRVSRVVAIEKDRRLAAECDAENAAGGIANVEIVTADALTVDWHELRTRSALGHPHWKIVGNIPYYITSPLLDKALTPPVPERIVFLVQTEVADRIVAAPGSRTYGALSVGVQVVSRAEKLFRVKAGSFQPPPEVDSTVIRLRPLRDPRFDAAELRAFRRFVVGCFSQRRKQLHNVLRGVTGSAPEALAAMLRAVGLDPAARPEAVGPEGFVRLWRESLRGRVSL